MRYKVMVTCIMTFFISVLIFVYVKSKEANVIMLDEKGQPLK